MSEIKKYQAKIVDVDLGKDITVVEPVNIYGCKLGDDVFVGPFVEIQKNATIGKNCKIQSHSFICELVTIGDNCFISHGVKFVNDKFIQEAVEILNDLSRYNKILNK